MTRKDYKLIADTINDSFNYILEGRGEYGEYELIETFINNLSYKLANDNTLFDSVKFKNACGLKAN